jgi:hypothetical protein
MYGSDGCDLIHRERKRGFGFRFGFRGKDGKRGRNGDGAERGLVSNENLTSFLFNELIKIE